MKNFLRSLLLVCVTLFSTTILADNLSVHVHSGIDFSKLNHNNRPVWMQISVVMPNGEKSLSGKSHSTITNEIINTTDPITELHMYNSFLPGIVIMSFEILDRKNSETYYSCSKKLYIKKFNDKTNYLISLNGLESNNCSFRILQ